MTGFPGLEELNMGRVNLFDASHGDGSAMHNLGCWLGHKVITLVDLPANVIGVGVGIAGMIVTASTVGVIKVAFFAVTLGNKLPFPTGFQWCWDRTVDAGYHFARNIGELLYDVANLIYRFVERIIIGFEKGIEGEPQKIGSFSFSQPLEALTNENRIDLSMSDRSFTAIGKHYLYSVANIPVNAVIALVSAVCTAVLLTAFFGKSLFYSATNLQIPFPTYVFEAIYMTGISINSVILDIATNVADVAVLIYKISEVLHLTHVLATARDVVFYIPEAMFS